MVKDLAERCSLTAQTIRRLEAGEPGVLIGVLANALAALGLRNHLRTLVDIASDDTGLMLSISELPKRIRRRRKKEEIAR